MILALFVILFLVGVSAFYVGTEFALVSTRRGQIRGLAQEGKLAARILLPIVSENRRLYRAVTACQIGITATSLALGAFVQSLVGDMLVPLFSRLGGDVAARSAAVVVGLVAAVMLQVIFGEMIPKSIALRNPLRWVMIAALPLRWSQFLFSWFVAVLGGSASALLRLLGVPEVEKRGLRSPAELGLIVAESARVGAVDQELRDSMHNALRFTTLAARDVMVPRVRVRGLPADIDAADLSRALSEANHTRLPIYEGSLDRIIGFVHAKDVLLRGNGEPPPVRSLLRPALTVPWSAPAGELLERMRAAHTAFAVVLDEHGGTAGIVTLEDLVEEVIGEVEDEFDPTRPRLERFPDGRLLLRAEDPVSEVNERFRLGLSSEEAHTLGGLMMEALGRVGRVGDRAEVNGVILEIHRMEGRRIETILATPRPAPPEAD